MPITRVPGFSPVSTLPYARPRIPDRRTVRGLPRDTTVAKLSLAPGVTPATRTNHVLHVTARSIGALQGTIRMQLQPLAFQGTYLDEFTGADEDPITTNWTTPMFSGEQNIRRLSNAATHQASAGAAAAAWYDVRTFGPNCEAFFTYTTAPADGHVSSIYARVTNPGVGAAMDGYVVHLLKVAGAANDVIEIRRMDNDSHTTLGSGITQEVSDGDSIGIQCYGSAISAYYKTSAGSWTLLDTQNDSTYFQEGYFGIEIGALDTTATIDKFQGMNYDDDPFGSSYLETPVLTDSFVTYDLPLPDARAAEIVDYTALEAWLWGHSVLGDPVTFEVSEIYLTLPDQVLSANDMPFYVVASGMARY